MFKLVVLFALVAVAVAKPSGLYHEEAIQVANPIVAKTYIAPAAVSSSYRQDIINKPAVVAYSAAPAYAYAAPAYAYAAPVVHKAVGYGPSVAHAAYAYSAPAVYAW